MPSAHRTSIQTPEILENILLYVDERSLLISTQRVCKYWHEVISTSPPLQKHLYFNPDWDQKTKSTSKLLTEAFPLWFVQTRTSHPGETPRDNVRIINNIPADFNTLPLALPHRNEAFMRKDASWRNMLVQQPPIPCLVVFKISSEEGGDDFSGPFVNGTRLGDLPVQATHMNSRSRANLLRMGSFYDEIIPTAGAIPWQWIILRNTGQVNVPSSIRDYQYADYQREILECTLQQFGMAMVVRQTKQSKKPFLWTPGEHFVWRH